MKVLIIRHAIAEEKAKDDASRKLTGDGRAKMRAAVGGLKEIVGEIDVLASSPLVRAVETAAIVGKAYGGKKSVPLAALQPGKPVNAVLHWLQGQKSDQTIALVGHEPQLGILVSWLLCGEQKSFVELRKGSATLLEFKRHLKAGTATLLWTLKPGILRKIGKGLR